jgi:uncharacterized protein DUF1214
VPTAAPADKNDLDGGKTYKVVLPKNIPEANFWSFTLYDNQTRSMLVETPQRYPRAGSQSYPSPAAEASADGSTTVYFGPTQPAGVNRGNWDPDQSRQGVQRNAAPLQPARTVLHKGVAAERDRIGEVSGPNDRAWQVVVRTRRKRPRRHVRHVRVSKEQLPPPNGRRDRHLWQLEAVRSSLAAVFQKYSLQQNWPAFLPAEFTGEVGIGRGQYRAAP